MKWVGSLGRWLVASFFAIGTLFAWGQIGSPFVYSNVALQALPTYQYPGGVYRLGFYVAEDTEPVLYFPSNSPCPDGAGSGDNGSQVRGSNGNCWIANWPNYGMDLRDWGCKFDNSTDNSACLNNAIIGHNRYGGTIRVPLTAGTAALLVNTRPSTSITKGGLVFQGLGVPGQAACADLADNNITGSIIRFGTAVTTGDLFTVATEDRTIFRDIMIDFAQTANCANVQRTSGAAIAVVGANSTYTRNFLAENIQCRYQFDCIRLDFVNAWQVLGLLGSDTKNDCVKLVNTDASTDFGDWVLDRMVCWNVDYTASGVGNAGFEFLRGGSGAFTNNKVNGVKYGYLINRTCVACSTTATSTSLAAGNSIENFTIGGMVAQQASTGADMAVIDWHDNEFGAFSNFANPSQGDIKVSTGTPGGADTRWIRNFHAHDNKHNGGYTTAGGAVAFVDIEDGLLVTVHDETIDNNSTGGTNPKGIQVAGSVSNCQVNNNKVFQSTGTLYGTLNACDGPTQAWVPNVAGSVTAGTPTYTVDVGSWEVHDQDVTVRFQVILSAWGGSPAGNITITNLPVTSANAAGDVGSCSVTQWSGLALAANYTYVGGNVAPAGNTIAFTQEGSGQTAANLPVSAGSAFTMQGSCIYHR